MSYDFRYEVEDGIATITFDRPEVLNALTLDIYAQLRDLFEALRYDDAVQGAGADRRRARLLLRRRCPRRSSASCSSRT